MLVIYYHEAESKEKQNNKTFPPIFVELNETTLNQQVYHLIKHVYDQLKEQLSTFVKPQHLRIQLPNKQIMYTHTPLYMYINYGQYTQQLSCRIDSIAAIKQQNLQVSHSKNTLLLRISQRNKQIVLPLQNLPYFSFLKQKNLEELKKIDEIIKDTDKVVIKGKYIIKSQKEEWSSWIHKKWKEFENQRNQCLYICIDRD